MTKGQVHEGIIRITDKGSVVTWDFDVMRHDVVFTVYRLKHPLKNKSPSSTPSPTPTSLATFNYPKKRDRKDNSDTSDNKATVAIAAKEQSTGQQSSNRYKKCLKVMVAVFFRSYSPTSLNMSSMVLIH